MERNIAHRGALAGVTVRRNGNIARVQLDDGRGNVLGTAALKALGAAIAEAAAADAVMLTGRARIFCGGLDLDEIAPMSYGRLLEFLELLHATRRALFALERPLIVAAAGSAVGAGAALVCCGDQRLGARDAGVVGFTEARLGVPLPASAMAIAESALDLPTAARVLLFGELFSKEDAFTKGFFHQLTEPDRLLDEAEQAAHAAASVSRASSLIKRTLRKDALRRMDRERSHSHEVFAREWTSPAAQDRIQAVLKGLRAPR